MEFSSQNNGSRTETLKPLLILGELHHHHVRIYVFGTERDVTVETNAGSCDRSVPPSHISLPSAAPKAMQCDFRRTVQAHRNDARSCTYRGVAYHVAILPGSRSHPSWQHRLQLDRNRSRKAKLATVRVTAQHQIEISMGSLAINFRCMRQ
jgi:hypothetical protein